MMDWRWPWRRKREQRKSQSGRNTIGKRWLSPRIEQLEDRRVLVTASELVFDIATAPNLGSDPQFLTVVGNLVFFTANNGTNGRELYSTSGAPGVQPTLYDIRVGGGNSDPQQLINVNGFIYFTADDGQFGREVYTVLGNSASRVTDMAPGTLSSDPRELTNVNGTLYFSAADGGLVGRELYSVAGGGQPTLVKDLRSGGNSSNPNNLRNVNGTLFLGANDGNSGEELWMVQGGSYTFVKDINPGGGGSSPTNGADINGVYFFYATDGSAAANELWISDGTSLGTVMVIDLNQNDLINNGQANIQEMVNFNGLALFSGISGSAGGGTSFQETFYSDGTAAGTGSALFTGFTPIGDGDPRDITIVNDVAFLSSDQDGSAIGVRRELYVVTRVFFGANGSLVKDIFPGTQGSNPTYLINAEGSLYFAATGSTADGNEIWRSDGTAVGTNLESDVNTAGSSNPTYLAYFNGYVYFSAAASTSVGRELYRVKAIPPNQAPILNNSGDPTLNQTTTFEDSLNPSGTSVSSLIASVLPLDMITDPDPTPLEGIAITAVDTSIGTWQFSTNSGLLWSPIPAVSDAGALVLTSSANNLIRVLPNPDFFGNVNNALTFRAWDRYRGSNGMIMIAQPTGGSSPFSDDSETASITITPVADTPPDVGIFTAEDTDSSPIFLPTNTVDVNSVTHFRITAITGGQVINSSTLLPITTGSFVLASQTIFFRPTPNSTVSGSFLFQAAVDSGLGPVVGGSPATATVTITPVGDPPTVTPATMAEDPGSPQTGGGLVISRNPLDGAEVQFFRISNVTNGTVYLADGVTIVTDPSIITFADATAGLRFLPAPNFNGTATFSVQAATSAGGGGLSSPTVVSITVTAVNDDPVNSVPPSQISLINTDFPLSIATGNPVSIADIDAGAGTVTTTVSLVPGTGTLILPGATGSGTNSVSVGGTVTAVNTLLNNLVYRPPNPAFLGNVQVTIATNDRGNTGAGGALIDTDQFIITVANLNIAPVNTVPATQVFNEDVAGGLVFSMANGNAISVTDADAATLPLVVTLTTNHGILNVPTPGSVTIQGNGTATVILTGPQASLRAALVGLTYVPDAQYNGTASLTMVTNDQGFFGFGGALIDTDTVNFVINAVNDGPVGTAPATASVIEGEALIFSLANSNPLTVSDIDSASAPISVTLSAGHGTITALPVAGVTISNNSSPSVVITGPLINVQSALTSVTYTPDFGFFGADALTMFTNDLGNTGNGGALTDTDTVAITVININRPPVHTVPNTQMILEDTSLVFSTGNGNAISVTDNDSGTLDVVSVIAVQNGTLTFPATPGLTISGNGTAQVTVTGAVATISMGLNGLQYSPTLNFAGTDTLTIVTNDQGNSGVGGAKIDSDTVFIAVAAVNDPPVNTVPGPQDTGINSPIVFSSTTLNGISISDPDAGTTLVQVTLTVDNGILTLGSTLGTAVSGDGTSTVTVAGNLTAINFGLNNLRFNPTPGFQGSATLQIVVNDMGNTGAGGPLVDTDTVVIRVRPPFQVEGDTLYVTGTIIDDVMGIAFSSPTAFVATINGMTFPGDTTTIPNIRFTGGLGNDQLSVNDSILASFSQLAPFSLQLTTAQYTVSGATTEKIYVFGDSADTAGFNDSAGNDTLTALPGTTILEGPGFLLQTVGLGRNTAQASTGTDLAFMYDSTGDDVFTTLPQFNTAVFQGPGVSYQATGFDQVYGYAYGGGNDVALMFDDVTNDLFTGLQTFSVMYGPSFYHVAIDFVQVYAFSYTGGYDQAVLYDSIGDDIFYGLQDYTLLYAASNSYLNQATSFDYVAGFATTGNDQAVFFDTTAADTFTAFPTQAIMQSIALGLSYQALGFDGYTAFSSVGPAGDVANLYDSSGNDSFYGLTTTTVLVGTGYSSQAIGFSISTAIGINGGSDSAVLFDSVGDDNLSAAANNAMLTYGNGRRVGTSSFGVVRAISDAGGSDSRQVAAIDFLLEVYGNWPSN